MREQYSVGSGSHLQTRRLLDTLRRLRRYTAREVYPLLFGALHAAEPELSEAA